jgi:hypothetical protein
MASFVTVRDGLTESAIVIDESPRIFRKAVVTRIQACLMVVGILPKVIVFAWLYDSAEANGTVVEP